MLEQNANYAIQNFIAVARSLASARLASERMALGSRDLIYSEEAIKEHYLWLRLAGPEYSLFEQACSSSIFGSITRPAQFFQRMRRQPASLADLPAWHGKAQLLTAVHIGLSLILRQMQRVPYLRLLSGLLSTFTHGSVAAWTMLSIVGFLAEGRVDARTASIVPKSPKQFLKSFSALLSLFVPLPLCTINVPSVIWLTLYKLFALLARLSVFQHIFNPPFRRGLGLNQAEWSRCVAKLHSLWRHHQTAAVEAPTGTGKGQVLLNLLHECHGGILALATTRTVRDGLPGTLSAIASLESCFI
jgi:hypothetical protein